MADQNTPGLNFVRIHTDSNGNLYYADAKFGAAEAVLNDDYFIMPLPIGMKIINVTSIVTVVTTTASATFDVGTKQQGAGDWTDDLSAFTNVKSLRALAAHSSLIDEDHAPVRITEPNVYLTFTPKGASPAVAFEVYFEVTYVYEGFV